MFYSNRETFTLKHFRLFKQPRMHFFCHLLRPPKVFHKTIFLTRKKMQSMKVLNSAPLPSIGAPLPSISAPLQSIPSSRRQGSRLNGSSTRDKCDGIELGQIARGSRSITKDAPADGTQIHKLKHEMDSPSRERFAKLPPIKKSEAKEVADTLPNCGLNKKLPGNIYTHNITINLISM